MSRKKKHNHLIPYPDLDQLAGHKQPLLDNAVALNGSRYTDYMLQFTNLAMSRFEWLNLPSTVDERFLEFTLLTMGSVAFFLGADNNMNGYFATKWVNQKPLNIYYNPTQIRSVGSNGWNYEVANDNFVIIWDSVARQPVYKTLMNFAYKLTDIDRTLDVIRKHAKMPYLITGPQELQEPMVNLWRQIDSNQPAVLAYKDSFDNIQINALQTTNTSLPQMIQALQQSKQDIMNEALEFLGISPNSPSKASQQSIAESDQQHENIRFAMWSYVEARRQAVKEINKKFGLDVGIVVAHDIMTDNYNMATDEMIDKTVSKGADVGNRNKHDGGRING